MLHLSYGIEGMPRNEGKEMNAEHVAKFKKASAYAKQCKKRWDVLLDANPFDWEAEKCAYETYQSALAATWEIRGELP